mgnify:CR=1 FL=1
MKNKYTTLLLVIAAIITIFLARAVMASVIPAPRTFEIFDIFDGLYFCSKFEVERWQSIHLNNRNPLNLVS